MTEFVAWPKTPRWNREVIITEKIDGTNGAIIIEELDPEGSDLDEFALAEVVDGEIAYDTPKGLVA